MARFPLILLGGLLLVAMSCRAQGPPARVTVIKVETREFQPMRAVLGEIQGVREGRVSSEIDGLVSEVHVLEGIPVEAGDPLVQLATDSLEIKRREAEASLRLVQEQLAELEAGSRPEDIAEAAAALKEAEATLQETENDLERARTLRKTDAASEQELTLALSRCEAARALVAQKKARRDRVVAGPRREEIARVRAQRDMAQAVLDQIVQDIGKARIPAPFDGVVTARLVEKGSFVRRGDGVVSLIQMDPIWFSVAVPESLIARVARGATLELALDAMPGRRLSGTVEAIIPLADRSARTFPVRIRLDNADHTLLPGMAGRAWIPDRDRAQGLAVPRDAVVRGPMGPVVCVLRDGKVAMVPVRIGASEGSFVRIDGELSVGETVVLRGNERLRPGQGVEVLREEDGSTQGGR